MITLNDDTSKSFVVGRKEDLFMKLVGGPGGPELLATLQRNLPEFSPSLIPQLAKGDTELFAARKTYLNCLWHSSPSYQRTLLEF